LRGRTKAQSRKAREEVLQNTTWKHGGAIYQKPIYSMGQTGGDAGGGHWFLGKNETIPWEATKLLS